MKIDVFHDIACPWCRIGKAHLRAALTQWEGDVTVQYHPFFLNAGIPPQGADFREYMMNKGRGFVNELEQFFAAPREMGQRVGIVFNFEQITRAPNTLLAHRLVALTPELQQPQMIDALYDAYFQDGENIGDIDVLTRIAIEQGWDADDIRARLESDEAVAQVVAQASEAQRLGVTGVPMFVFNNTFALSGAQPPDVILRTMQQAEAMTA